MALCVQGIFDNTCFDPRIVVGSTVELVVSVCWFSMYCCHHTTAFLCTNTSKKGSLLSFSVSMVNSMLCLRELILERKSSRDSCPWGHMTKVLSMYWYHREGGFGLFWWPSFQYSIYRSANTGDSGEPTGAPSTCLYSWTSSGKYVDFHA